MANQGVIDGFKLSKSGVDSSGGMKDQKGTLPLCVKRYQFYTNLFKKKKKKEGCQGESGC